MYLYNKIAIVTGGSRGIGRAIALELAKAGASVVVNYAERSDKALEVVEEIKGLGGSAMAFKADVTQKDQVKKLMEETKRNFGKIDILVNNAGISQVGLFCDVDYSVMKRIIDTDLIGVMNATQEVMHEMISKKSGVIINISSIWGGSGASCEAVYSAAKSAINGFTKALAKELGPSNIRVNAVAPGVIETEMNSWLSKEEREALLNEIPLGRFGSPEDIGRVVRFLCGEDAAYITGQIINVDGAII